MLETVETVETVEQGGVETKKLNRESTETTKKDIT